MWSLGELLTALMIVFALWVWITSDPAKRFFAWVWRGVLASIISPPPTRHYVTPPAVPLSYDDDIDTGIEREIPLPPLTPQQHATILAQCKTVDNKPLSANAIYNIVGGNRNQVLAWVKAARPASAEEQPLHVTPIVGRPTAARFSADDLEYEQPPQGR